jgi:beta-ketodecanoyl-[acyl-carrier-protein] synthase
MYKEGILDPNIMQPIFHKRLAGETPEMVEMAAIAAKEALAQAGRTADEVDLIICHLRHHRRQQRH